MPGSRIACDAVKRQPPSTLCRLGNQGIFSPAADPVRLVAAGGRHLFKCVSKSAAAVRRPRVPRGGHRRSYAGGRVRIVCHLALLSVLRRAVPALADTGLSWLHAYLPASW